VCVGLERRRPNAQFTPPTHRIVLYMVFYTRIELYEVETDTKR